VFAAVNPNWLLLAGVAVLASAMVRLTCRRYWPARPPQDAAPATRFSSPGATGLSPSYQELLRSLERKEVEFQELSREALARLDNKIFLLQRLLAESEATIARLQQAAEDPRSRPEAAS
jgi:hypothetical protein